MKLLKDRLAAGRRQFSFNIRLSRTVETVSLAKSCGYDWLFIDMEHAALDLETVQALCIAGLAHELSPLVRVPDLSWASRVMDVGAGGIILPHVESAEHARDLVDRCLFAPGGHRSLSGPLPQLGLARMPTTEIIRRGNEEAILVVMIETPRGLGEADRIAAVPGIDVVLIGSNDLAAELGIPGALSDARIEDAYRQVVAACHHHGKQPGMGGIYEPALMARYLSLGILFAQGGGDSALLADAARARIEFLRGLPSQTRSTVTEIATHSRGC